MFHHFKKAFIEANEKKFFLEGESLTLKGYFQSKTEEVNITIEFGLLECV